VTGNAHAIVLISIVQSTPASTIQISAGATLADQRMPAAHKARLVAEIDRLGKLLDSAGITPDP
jgi:hypothetical protein